MTCDPSHNFSGRFHKVKCFTNSSQQETFLAQSFVDGE